ncbi:meiosis protein SPO22/ZIP4 like-domain-containing protein [Myxozyma melibiosi]|uniref:Meiosis protein SPO22/ZIP4 like-domain-containing protein n=1 Tax=Myxozyma melibiosi TaxID=54550 RepID=A0ABR1FC79_9ASCO
MTEAASLLFGNITNAERGLDAARKDAQSPVHLSSAEKRVNTIYEQARSIYEHIKDPSKDTHSLVPMLDSALLTVEQFLASLAMKSKISTLNSCKLDEIGVQLWNLATVFSHEAAEREEGGGAEMQVLCTVRAFACLLIECCERLSKGAGADLRVFKAYLKAMKSCLDNDAIEALMKLLTRVPKIYDAAVASQEQVVDKQAGFLVKVEYCVIRIYAAWKTGNYELMITWYSKLPTTTSHTVPTRKLEYLVKILSTIGTEFARRHDSERAESWLEHALSLFSLANSRDEDEPSEALLELKYNISRNLVRAYCSGSDGARLEKAKRVLQSMDDEYPSTIWSLVLKFEIAVKEGASAETLSDSIMQMIFIGNLDATSFPIIMSKIRSLSELHPLHACKALDYLLTKKLSFEKNVEWTHRVLLSRLAIAARLGASGESIAGLEKLFAELERLLPEALPTNVVNSGQSIIWSIAASCFARSEYQTANSWFALAISSVFANGGEINRTKIIRKMMLCEVHLQNYEHALELYTSRMPASAKEAPLTQYLLFKTALGMFDDSLDRICNSPTTDCKILSACAMEAQERDNKQVTLAAMKLILQKIGQEATAPTSGSQPGRESVSVHIPALLRCVIRLIILDGEKNPGDGGEDGAARSDERLEQLCRYFENSYDMAKQSRGWKFKDPAFSFDQAEYEWFSRTAYNTALKFCKTWPAECTLRLSEISLKFLALYEQVVNGGCDGAVVWQTVAAKFLATSASIYLARSRHVIVEQQELFQATLRHTKEFLSIASKYLTLLADDDAELETKNLEVQAKTAAVLSFQFESAVNLELWSTLPEIVESVIDLVGSYASQLQGGSQSAPRNLQSLKIYESLIDILLSSRGPTDDVLQVLQLIMRSVLADAGKDIAKLSRWIRCILTIALPRRASVAEDIINQVRVKLSEEFKERYPAEEIHWLATTCWNFGIDLYCSSDLSGCKHWLGIAIQLAGHLSPVMASQMLSKYNTIYNPSSTTDHDT